MNYTRRKDDQNIELPLPANVEGRFATIEATFKNQGRLLEDFIQETRKTTNDLFNGLNRLSDIVSAHKSTNWQQLGVMFSIASAVAGFVYMAFVAPLQDGQRKVQEDIEKGKNYQLILLERIHQNELDIKVHIAKEGKNNE